MAADPAIVLGAERLLQVRVGVDPPPERKLGKPDLGEGARALVKLVRFPEQLQRRDVVILAPVLEPFADERVLRIGRTRGAPWQGERSGDGHTNQHHPQIHAFWLSPMTSPYPDTPRANTARRIT
jgi:hypothetical protein